MNITRIVEVPMGHIVDLDGRKFLVDSRRTCFGNLETMVFSTGGKRYESKYQGYRWNWRKPVVERIYRDEAEMLQGHHDILTNLKELIS